MTRLQYLGVTAAAWPPLGATLASIIAQELASVFAALAPQVGGRLPACVCSLGAPGGLGASSDFPVYRKMMGCACDSCTLRLEHFAHMLEILKAY